MESTNWLINAEVNRDIWVSLNETDGQRRMYMEIHGSHEEIAILLREIQESADNPA